MTLPEMTPALARELLADLRQARQDYAEACRRVEAGDRDAALAVDLAYMRGVTATLRLEAFAEALAQGYVRATDALKNAERDRDDAHFSRRMAELDREWR